METRNLPSWTKRLLVVALTLLFLTPQAALASWRTRCIFEGKVESISRPFAGYENGAQNITVTLNVTRARELKGNYVPSSCTEKIGKPLDIRIVYGEPSARISRGEMARILFDFFEGECGDGPQLRICRMEQNQYIHPSKRDDEFNIDNPPLPQLKMPGN